MLVAAAHSSPGVTPAQGARPDRMPPQTPQSQSGFHAQMQRERDTAQTARVSEAEAESQDKPPAEPEDSTVHELSVAALDTDTDASEPSETGNLTDVEGDHPAAPAPARDDGKTGAASEDGSSFQSQDEGAAVTGPAISEDAIPAPRGIPADDEILARIVQFGTPTAIAPSPAARTPALIAGMYRTEAIPQTGRDKSEAGLVRDHHPTGIVAASAGKAATVAPLKLGADGPAQMIPGASAGSSPVDATGLSYERHPDSLSPTAFSQDRTLEQVLRSLPLVSQEKLVAALRMQLLSDVRPGSPGVMSIQLSPAELGGVQIRIMMGEAGMQILFQIERIETLDLLRRFSTDLAQDLRDLGFSDPDLSFSHGSARDRHGSAVSRPADSPAPNTVNGQTPNGPIPVSIRHDGKMDLRI